ncbi:MAG TPA: alpha/beta fold hydrolase, partial [Puia sp.]|nr:alpha/beta fold hydrolase [Puia sp.]
KITKKKVYRWLKVLILLYCIIGIAFYYLQERILFHPVAVDMHAPYHFDQPFNEVDIPYNKETNIDVIQFTTADTPRGVVLYFHGNKDNVTHYATFASDFTTNGYEIWMMDYPGYGKSTGKFSEENLYAQALVLYKLARSKWRPDQIIIYGKSLGTGVAAQLADVRDCRRLILECPYYSMTSLVRHYMPIWPVGSMLHFKFPTWQHLPQVTAPITIFHGASDGVVPYSNASRLKPLLKKGDEFITIDGGGHNDLHDHQEFKSHLGKLLE